MATFTNTVYSTLSCNMFSLFIMYINMHVFLYLKLCW